MDFRGVGRGQLPSTVGGLLFHAAEHTQRHFGKLLVTVKVIMAKETPIHSTPHAGVDSKPAVK
tara:strand:- start:1798 stop:1986 length:189 start_codon:yes stop_codon:yes gene_type:complete